MHSQIKITALIYIQFGLAAPVELNKETCILKSNSGQQQGATTIHYMVAIFLSLRFCVPRYRVLTLLDNFFFRSVLHHSATTKFHTRSAYPCIAVTNNHVSLRGAGKSLIYHGTEQKNVKPATTRSA